MRPSLERWPTNAKEAPSSHDVRMTPLDTNPIFQQGAFTFQKGISIFSQNFGQFEK